MTTKTAAQEIVEGIGQAAVVSIQRAEIAMGNDGPAIRRRLDAVRARSNPFASWLDDTIQAAIAEAKLKQGGGAR